MRRHFAAKRDPRLTNGRSSCSLAMPWKTPIWKSKTQEKEKKTGGVIARYAQKKAAEALEREKQEMAARMRELGVEIDTQRPGAEMVDDPLSSAQGSVHAIV